MMKNSIKWRWLTERWNFSFFVTNLDIKDQRTLLDLQISWINFSSGEFLFWMDSEVFWEEFGRQTFHQISYCHMIPSDAHLYHQIQRIIWRVLFHNTKQKSDFESLKWGLDVDCFQIKEKLCKNRRKMGKLELWWRTNQGDKNGGLKSKNNVVWKILWMTKTC